MTCWSETVRLVEKLYQRLIKKSITNLTIIIIRILGMGGYGMIIVS